MELWFYGMFPTLIWGFHFGTLSPLCSVFSRKKTWHPKACSSVTQSAASERERGAIGGLPSTSNVVQLANCTASSIARVHNSKEIISGQFLMALIRTLRVDDCMCPMLPSTMPFWNWALTLQKSVVWLQAVHVLTKPSSAKCPFSAWKCRIFTPCADAMRSKPTLALIVSSRVKFSKRWKYMKGVID